MWFVPAVILVAVVIGYLFGGRLRNFEGLSVHWWSLAFLGLVLQAVPISTYWDLAPKAVGAARCSCPTCSCSRSSP